MKLLPVKINYFLVTLLILLIVGVGYDAEAESLAQNNLPERRVNVPYLGVAPPVDDFNPAIFWFGRVDETTNYADVRVYYYDDYLNVVVHIIDRLLWYDLEPLPDVLDEWDAVSLYLDLDGSTGDAPDSNAYRFVSQLNTWQADDDWTNTYRGNGLNWEGHSIPVTAETSWRGNYPNDDEHDKGWVVKYTIPFDSLGLASKPQQGTIWGLGVVVHDRDDKSGSAIPNQVWPEMIDPNIPSTWGELHFGIPGYSPPLLLPDDTILIRNGLNGVVVEDGHVGGNTTCGDGLDHWTEWGEANYAGDEQFNIQNQWDISDYPCFSKYFITIPLNTLPTGKEILNAKLSITLCCNAGGGDWGLPPDSYIQAFTIADEWVETTLTWNNAPMAAENINGTWVYPNDSSIPPQRYELDVSRAVNDAYHSGEPLRLAIYSADGEMHSGKYFWTSEFGYATMEARPSLYVTLGNSCDSPGVDCFFTYLPMLSR